MSRAKAALKGGQLASVALLSSEGSIGPDSLLNEKMCFWYHLGGSIGFKVPPACTHYLVVHTALESLC